ncbi:MAG: hypothetical protein ACUVQP_08010 [Bacteroidales bacterium]
MVDINAINEIISQNPLTDDENNILNKMAEKRNHIKEIKAVYILRKQHKTEKEIANIIGRDRRYIKRIMDRIMISPLKQNIEQSLIASAGNNLEQTKLDIEQIKSNLQNAAKDKLAFAIAAITPQKLMDASISDLSKIIKVNHEIYRLETGQSTKNIGIKGLFQTENSDAELADKIIKKMEIIEKFLLSKGIDTEKL